MLNKQVLWFGLIGDAGMNDLVLAASPRAVGASGVRVFRGIPERR